MRSAFRTPDQLAITIVRHELRSETSLTIHHSEEGLQVVLFDDFWARHDGELHSRVAEAVDVWCRTGPIAAATLCACWSRPARPRG